MKVVEKTLRKKGKGKERNKGIIKFSWQYF
jgi:hypothetical protein